MTLAARLAAARARRAEVEAPVLRLVAELVPVPRRRVDPAVLAAPLVAVVYDPSAGPRRTVLTNEGLVVEGHEPTPSYRGDALRYVGHPCTSRLVDRKSGQEVAVLERGEGGQLRWMTSNDAVLLVEPEPPGVTPELAARANAAGLVDVGREWRFRGGARRPSGGPVVARCDDGWRWAPPRATFDQWRHAPVCSTEAEALTALLDWLALPAAQRPDWLEGRRPDYLRRAR